MGGVMCLHARGKYQGILHGRRGLQTKLRAHGMRDIADDTVRWFGQRAQPRVATDGKRHIVVWTDLFDHGYSLRPQVEYMDPSLCDVGLAPGVGNIAEQALERQQAHAIATHFGGQQAHYLTCAAKALLRHARVPPTHPPLRSQHAPSADAR